MNNIAHLIIQDAADAYRVFYETMSDVTQEEVDETQALGEANDVVEYGRPVEAILYFMETFQFVHDEIAIAGNKEAAEALDFMIKEMLSAAVAYGKRAGIDMNKETTVEMADDAREMVFSRLDEEDDESNAAYLKEVMAESVPWMKAICLPRVLDAIEQNAATE